MLNKEEDSPEGYIPVSISMLPIDVAILDRLAREKHLSRSEFVRQIFGLWLRDLSAKFHPPLAGVFTDKAGNIVCSGLLSDEGKAKFESGEWVLKKAF